MRVEQSAGRGDRYPGHAERPAVQRDLTAGTDAQLVSVTALEHHLTGTYPAARSHLRLVDRGRYLLAAFDPRSRLVAVGLQGDERERIRPAVGDHAGRAGQGRQCCHVGGRPAGGLRRADLGHDVRSGRRGPGLLVGLVEYPVQGQG